ncbi:hypothetical protein I7X12_04470 [Halosimplex litoreum]|uniref:Uncharacterized protein n=1 Tax=Halosimplex litoreum TaxID=1198301 RepID=A0A7T3G023_9EURY|nr:hypothetical protein [Halosimplex litoreum]QPV63891.1 hypothetical protein I7X12_04470 [Halosimplex litoreum]
MTDTDPSDLASRSMDGLSVSDVETVLSAEPTTIAVIHDGETFLKPQAKKVRVDRPRARYLEDKNGRRTEISLKMSFVATPEDFANEGDDGGRADDWGLSAVTGGEDDD